MSYEIVNSKTAVFVVWGTPTRSDLDQVLARVRELACATGGPIVFVARVPPDAPAPEAEARRHLFAILPGFIQLCSSYHVVLEGDEFVNAIKRSVLAGMFQLGWRRGGFFVHSNIAGLVRNAPNDVRPEVEALLAVANARGLLDRRPALAGPERQHFGATTR